MERSPRSLPVQADRVDAGAWRGSEASVLPDHSPRGANLNALAQLANTGPTAVAQRQRLSTAFGDAADVGVDTVAQFQKLRVPKGMGRKPWRDLKAAVKAYNKLPDVTHQDFKTHALHEAGLKAVRDAITVYGKDEPFIDNLKSDVADAEFNLDDQLWGSVAAVDGKPGQTTKVKDPEGIREGSMADAAPFAHLKRNVKWEVVFRKLSNVRPGKFDLARENDEILDASRTAISIPRNSSDALIAVGRNPEFSLIELLGDKQAWVNKLCYAAILPADYGVDLEAEYLDYLAWRRDSGKELQGEEDKVKPKPGDKGGETFDKRAAREIDILRMPAVLVIGWVYRTEEGMVYVDNPDFVAPEGQKVDPGPFEAWRGLIRAKHQEIVGDGGIEGSEEVEDRSHEQKAEKEQKKAPPPPGDGKDKEEAYL